MSSRQEEKERRKREREEREAQAARGERRRKLMGYGVGGLLGLAAVAAIVVAVAAGGGDGGSEDRGDRPKATGANVPIPAPKETNLQKAARAAGCTARSFTPTPNDRIHVTGRVTYPQNPPVFGQHAPTPASDGNYVGVDQPSTETIVHGLEHGRVVIWYKPSLPQRRIRQLEALFVEPYGGKQEGYKLLLVSRANMPFEVAASAWGQQLGCKTFTEGTFDAVRAFRLAYVDKGPELVPYPE